MMQYGSPIVFMNPGSLELPNGGITCHLYANDHTKSVVVTNTCVAMPGSLIKVWSTTQPPLTQRTYTIPLCTKCQTVTTIKCGLDGRVHIQHLNICMKSNPF